LWEVINDADWRIKLNIKEMIEVLQAFERGEKIELRVLDSDHKAFNFAVCEYRIAPKPKKRVKLLAVFCGTWLHYCTESHAEQVLATTNWQRVPTHDQVIEVEDV
jgi:hypothetical protein